MQARMRSVYTRIVSMCCEVCSRECASFSEVWQDAAGSLQGYWSSDFAENRVLILDVLASCCVLVLNCSIAVCSSLENVSAVKVKCIVFGEIGGLHGSKMIVHDIEICSCASSSEQRDRSALLSVTNSFSPPKNEIENHVPNLTVHLILAVGASRYRMPETSRQRK
jgi:hypothetical protein